jgi:hypothetical protein
MQNDQLPHSNPKTPTWLNVEALGAFLRPTEREKNRIVSPLPRRYGKMNLLRRLLKQQ